MSRSIRSRQGSGNYVSQGSIAGRNGRSAPVAPSRQHRQPVRVIGLPIPVTIPTLRGVRLRYCSRTDEQIAAVLAKSMLRVGISRVKDWTGSAVDFVATGLARFCQGHGLREVSRVFSESSIRLTDEMIELTEYGRSQTEVVEQRRMFLMVDYHESAIVPIGATLSYLESINPKLPAAFYMAFSHNVARWMRVYDCRDAEFYAADCMEMLEEQELKESFFPRVKRARPRCLAKLPTYQHAARFIQRSLPEITDKRAATLLRHCVQMHDEGEGRNTAYPWQLRDTLPEMEDYIENTDEPGPGVCIVFEENDLIEACFTEQMQYLGQEHAISSSLMFVIDLSEDEEGIDRQVRYTFDHLAAMVRSLAVASPLIEMIRGISNEHIRQGRRKPGVHAQPGSANVRPEQL
jgi:hypothetical protein